MKYVILTIVAIVLVGAGVMYFTPASPVENSPVVETNPNSQTIEPSTQPATNSNLVTVTDLASTYSIQLPRDWQVKRGGGFEQTGEGLKRLSLLTAQSPDWKLEGGSELNSGHVASGAAMEIYVFNQHFGHAPSEIEMTVKLVSSNEIIIDGEAAKLETYREYNPPNDREGLTLDAVVIRNGIFYTFRIAFNSTTYPQSEKMFTDILKSIKFTDQ